MQRFRLKSPTLEIAVCLGLALVAYLPVMAHVSLRPTGDEKVYIAQALEMAHRGTWYAQTLAGQPNYYKGPLFYVLLRLGFLVFGETSAWSLSWMNFAGLLGAGVALGLATWRTLRDRGAVLVGVGMTLLAAGTFAHALASQMEALLIVAYAVSASLVVMAPSGRAGVRHRAAAWVVIGAAGWLKSPVHSALLGTSALLYWSLTKGEIGRLARSWRDWLGALLGVAVGIAGYLPSLLFDRTAFWNTYILRETLGKVGNGVTVVQALTPLVSSHFLPWTPLLFVPLVARRRHFTPGERRLLKLVLAFTLPTVVFFSAHPCRNEVYVLPVLPLLALLVAVGWRRSFRTSGAWLRRLSLRLAMIIAGVFAVGVAVICAHFSPLPTWWGGTTTPLACLGLFLATAFFWRAARASNSVAAACQALLAMTLLLFGAGRVFIAIGEREVADPRALAGELGTVDAGPWYKLDLTRYLWNEWGLLNFTLGHPVAGVHSEAQLQALLAPGRVFLAPDAAQLAVLTRLAGARTDLVLDVHPWHRWNIHGEQPDGTPAWKAAWRSRDLAFLEHTESIVVVKGRPVVASGG